MDNTRTRLDALAFVYDTIHAAGSHTWLRALTNGQVQDLANIIAAWEEKRHPRLRGRCTDPLNSSTDCVAELREVEKAAILDAVDRLGVRRAAAALGLGKTTIYRKLREYEGKAEVQSSNSALTEDAPNGIERYRM